MTFLSSGVFISALVVCLYLSFLALIGWLAARKPQTNQLTTCEEEARHLGGRELGPITTALSAHASDMSAWLFMALPLLVYTRGQEGIWVAIGLFFGMMANWLLIAKKLRIETEKAGASNLPQWFSAAFSVKKDSKWLPTLCALATICFMFFYLVAGLTAMGILFHELFSLPPLLSLSLSLAVIFFYTALGGYQAIAAIDLFQGLFLLCVILIVPTYTFYELHFDASLVGQAIENRAVSLSLFSDYKTVFKGILTAITWAMGYMGMPHILNKFMGIKNPDEMKAAMKVGMVWHFFALLGSILIGVCAFGFFDKAPVHSDQLFVTLVEKLFSRPFAALIFCAIIAANISTIDSQLHVASMQLTDFFLKPLLRGSKIPLRVPLEQLAVLLVCLPALALAATGHNTLQQLVELSWSGLGASFGPLVFASLYLPRKVQLTPRDAYTSLILSFSGVWFWQILFRAPFLNYFGIDLPPLLPGFVLGLCGIFFMHLSLKRS